METKKTETGRLSVKTLLSYGVGAIGEGIGYNVFFAFFTFFLTTQAGIAPAVAGVISGVAVLWDAVTDPIIGNWSDRTRNPRGRRRPFIMTGSVLFGVAIALLYVDLNIPYTAKVVYYILVNMLYWLALTTGVIPHISLGSELTEDYDERTKLRTYAVTLMGIGTLIAVGTPLLLVESFTKMTGSARGGWALAGAAYGALTILVYQLCCRFLKGKEPANPNLESDAEQTGIRESLSTFKANAGKAFRNKPLGHLLGITFFVNVVVTLGSGLAIYLLTYVYQYNEARSSLVYTLQGIFVVVAAALMGIAAGKMGKKLVMVLSIVIYMAAYVVIAFLPIAFPTLVFSLVLFALGNSGYWAMIYAMSYDASVIEQIRSGEKPDGLYTSLIGLVMKFGNAIGSVVVGVGLQLIGFSESSEVQTEAVVRGIRSLYAFSPALILAAALVFALIYPLTRQRYDRLTKALERKQAGEEYDAAVMKGL